jgi:hypothetical protein
LFVNTQIRRAKMWNSFMENQHLRDYVERKQKELNIDGKKIKILDVITSVFSLMAGLALVSLFLFVLWQYRLDLTAGIKSSLAHSAVKPEWFSEAGKVMLYDPFSARIILYTIFAIIVCLGIIVLVPLSVVSAASFLFIVARNIVQESSLGIYFCIKKQKR